MLQWDEARHSLGVEGMDATHREFAEMAEALAKADDAAFPALFQQLLDHTRQHFAEEGRLMRLCKFPPIAIHEAEHARVLDDLIQLNRHVQGGRPALARAFVESGLKAWFDLHLATMDRALAGHLARTRVLESRGQAGA
jgi:hemerythrin-like metal-binding protein